jgi:hypothetical protein
LRRMVPFVSVIVKSRLRALSSTQSCADFWLLGCRQDANIAGQATGAMSWAFVTALKKNPQQSYVQLLNSIRDELATKYSQKPQLSCSHPLSMYHFALEIATPKLYRPRKKTNIHSLPRYGLVICNVSRGYTFGCWFLGNFRPLSQNPERCFLRSLFFFFSPLLFCTLPGYFMLGSGLSQFPVNSFSHV